MQGHRRRTLECYNLGDRNYLDYGSFFVWRYVEDGNEYTDLIWFEPVNPEDGDSDGDYDSYASDRNMKYRLYLESLEDTHEDEWYWKDIGLVARFIGITADKARDMLVNGSILDQASIVKAVYDYHGPQSDPDYYTRGELNKRFRTLFTCANKHR